MHCTEVLVIRFTDLTTIHVCSMIQLNMVNISSKQNLFEAVVDCGRVFFFLQLNKAGLSAEDRKLIPFSLNHVLC